MISSYNSSVAPSLTATNKGMYSSYGNQRRNSNVLRFTPPGFKFSIDVQFPPRCLPVCERCKKNFKTREHCRGRDCHTELAWCETYVCVSLDNSCTGDDNQLLDGPFMAKVVPPIAFNLKGKLNPLTPICAPCKDKNYTRTYCRQNKNHRQLPWSTVYVIVSLKPGVLPERSGPSSSASVSVSDGKRRKDNKGDAVKSDDEKDTSSEELKRKNSPSTDVTSEDALTPDTETNTNSADTIEADKSIEVEEEKEEEKDGNEDEDKELSIEELYALEAEKLKDIPRSRTFLATVSCKTHRIEWVDIDPMLESQIPMLDRSNETPAQDGYDMRGQGRNPMMHPSMQSAIGGRNMDSNQMHPGMDRMNMNRMRGGMHNGMMNPMGGYGNMPSMNGSHGSFNDDPRAQNGMDPQMMGGPMGRYGQDMMGHMEQMHPMDQMRQMRMSQMHGGMAGAIPFETPSMTSRMGGYGSSGGLTTQEMMQYDAMRREGPNQMNFDRQQQQQHMMNQMPYNAVSGGTFPGEMPMDRMGGQGEMMGRMPRPGMGSGPNSEMMMMMNQNGGMDMMPNGRGSAPQDVIRNSAFDRMSRGGGQGMGGPDMMRMGMIGAQGDRQFMGEHSGQGNNGVGGNYDNQDVGKEVEKNEQSNV